MYFLPSNLYVKKFNFFYNGNCKLLSINQWQYNIQNELVCKLKTSTFHVFAKNDKLSPQL